MKRSELLYGAAAIGVFSALPGEAGASAGASSAAPLKAPADGVPVAFLLSDEAVMIDFAGPWEVFQDARVPSRKTSTFNLYTVAESTRPVTASSGLKILPNFSIADAPAPKVVVIPGQSDPTPAVKAWLRHVARETDVMMSVCTGAFVLAEAGLLNGRTATTHHGSFTTLAMGFPDVTVRRGARFVDEGPVATSAGLSAGIDLALHIVSRYYGSKTARQTAYYMEYASQGWTNADSNMVYAKPPAVKAGEALCPVCWMDVDPKSAPNSTYKGKRYYFCMPAHKQRFESSPDRFLAV